MNYGLPTTVTVSGAEHAIRSDYRAILDIICALNDPDFTGQEKAMAVIAIFYENPDGLEDIEAAIQAAFSFIACGRPEEENGKKRPRLADWEKDFPHIISAVNKVAGREVRADGYCHWWTFMGYYDALDGESTFANIVSIRSKKAKGKKLEKWEQEWYRENRQMVDIRQPVEYTEQEKELLAALRGGKR